MACTSHDSLWTWRHSSRHWTFRALASLICFFLESASFPQQRRTVVYLLERCCVLSFKVVSRQRPLAAAPHCKHKSRCNECVMTGELEQAKCTDVPCVLAVCQISVVPHNHLQPFLFGTKLCATLWIQRFATWKYQPQHTYSTNNDCCVMSLFSNICSYAFFWHG